MSNDLWTPDLFAEAWSAGISAVVDERISPLQHLAVMTFLTIERYETTNGPLKREMDQVLEIGLAKIQRSGDAAPG